MTAFDQLLGVGRGTSRGGSATVRLPIIGSVEHVTTEGIKGMKSSCRLAVLGLAPGTELSERECRPDAATAVACAWTRDLDVFARVLDAALPGAEYQGIEWSRTTETISSKLDITVELGAVRNADLNISGALLGTATPQLREWWSATLMPTLATAALPAPITVS